MAVEIEDRNLDIDVDFEDCTWAVDEASDVEPPAEGAFPLIVMAGAKRYELYSDGTLAEVELETPQL